MATVFPDHTQRRERGYRTGCRNRVDILKYIYDIAMIRGTNIALNDSAGKTQECGNEKPRPRYSVQLFGERGECP